MSKNVRQTQAAEEARRAELWSQCAGTLAHAYVLTSTGGKDKQGFPLLGCNFHDAPCESRAQPMTTATLEYW